MPVTRKYIQHYRTSGTTSPQASKLVHGEIAVGFHRHGEKLFIKNDANTVTEFSSDELLKVVRDEQDIKVAGASGIVPNTESETGIVTYQYMPSAEILNEFDNMSDSVDFLAGKLKECLDLIEEMKSNVYMIDVNFNVEPNSAHTSYNVSYACEYNGNPTTPQSCTITKYVNDGSGTVILSNTSTASASTTSNITGNKEQYVLEVVPDLAGALNTRSELTRYMCYVGASSATTMTSSIVAGFDKYTSDGIGFIAQENTVYGEYLWIVIPSFINIAYVTCEGISVTLDQEVQTVTNTLGSFKCYRSYKALDTASWRLKINHITQ